MDRQKMIIPKFIDNILGRMTEPSTYASAGGGLAVFVWASENRDFIDYIEQKPIIAVVLGLFALGAMLKEKGQNDR